jgi:hypothetical protein
MSKVDKIQCMPRPRNPNADLHTVKIPRYLIGDLTARADELRKSLSSYIVDLIEADRVNQGRPLIVYPNGYAGPPVKVMPSSGNSPPKKRKKNEK